MVVVVVVVVVVVAVVVVWVIEPSVIIVILIMIILLRINMYYVGGLRVWRSARSSACAVVVWCSMRARRAASTWEELRAMSSSRRRFSSSVRVVWRREGAWRRRCCRNCKHCREVEIDMLL